MAKFRFKIHTGDEYQAGTDSNIFIILLGAIGKTGEYRLNSAISGDAFERNDWNEFTLDVNESYDELGPIYGICIRSDMRYGGAGWLLDQIEIYGKDDQKSTYKISQWIEDRNSHVYYDESQIRVIDEKRERNVESEAVYEVPAGTTASVTDTTEAVIGYRLSETKVTEITTSTSVGAEATASKKPESKLNLTQIKSTLSFALSTLNRKESSSAIEATTTRTFSQKIDFPICNTAKKYRPIYIEDYKNCKVQVGNLILEIPNVLSRKGAGYKEVE